MSVLRTLNLLGLVFLPICRDFVAFKFRNQNLTFKNFHLPTSNFQQKSKTNRSQ